MSIATNIRCEPAPGGWRCLVTVTGQGTPTSHEVSVSSAALGRLDPGASTPDDLVRRSFAFLLAREPKESILRRFEITEIGRYFPDWEREIRRAG